MLPVGEPARQWPRSRLRLYLYEPTAPFADDNGMVAGPNVDRANELLQLLVARYTFAANAQVIRADAQMSASLLNITA